MNRDIEQSSTSAQQSSTYNAPISSSGWGSLDRIYTAKSIREFCFEQARSNPTIGEHFVIETADKLAVYFVMAKTFDHAKRVIENGSGATAEAIIASGKKVVAFLDGADA